MKGEVRGFPPLSLLGAGKQEAGALCGAAEETAATCDNGVARKRSGQARRPALPTGGCLVPTAARLLLNATPTPQPPEHPGTTSFDAAASSSDDVSDGSDESGHDRKPEEGGYGMDGYAEYEDQDGRDGSDEMDQGLEVILEDSEEDRCSGAEQDRAVAYAPSSLAGARTASASAPSPLVSARASSATAAKTQYDLVRDALYADSQRKPVKDAGNSTPDFDGSSNLYRKKNLTKESSRNDSWLERSLLVNNFGRDLNRDGEKGDDNKVSLNGNLPSVRGLRNRFESQPGVTRETTSSPPAAAPAKEWMGNGQRASDGDLAGAIKNSSPRKINVNHDFTDAAKKPSIRNNKDDSEEYVARLRKFTLNWNPESLMDKLYSLRKVGEKEFNSHRYINISGTLDKLPSGRKKATFWNAWKSRYFKAENGLLSIYQKNSSETPLMTIQLMGGKVEVLKPIGMDENMLRNCTLLGIDDGKGHYVVVKCPNEIESNAWLTALQTQVVENYESTYVQPLSLMHGPSCTKDTLIIDLGSCSLRAGVLTTQPSLPQIFFPSVMAVHKETSERWYGLDAVSPEVRSESRMHFPIRPSAKITKYSVDLDGCYGLIEKVFKMLAVQPDGYNIFLCVPRSFNSRTLTSIVNTMFEKWRVKSLSISHQSVLTLYAYNARSGIVVDMGERTDVIPVSEGYILERGVSRTPYGSHQVIEMLKQLLNEKNYSFAADVETYLVRYIVENLCYCAQNYSAEHKEALSDLEKVTKDISIKDVYCDANSNVDSISLDVARFHAPEGLFNPDIWGHDNIGVHKMVHKGIQECSMDIRKEMIRSIYLSGGVTMIPGFASRLLLEIDKLTPPSITPKVHASPYRYHAAYIGATVLANSDQASELSVKRQEWMRSGAELLKKWNV